MEMDLQELDFSSLELWENSPRLPKSISNEVADMFAEDKMKRLIPFYYLDGISDIAGSLSVLGWSPIEFMWVLKRDDKYVVFDGCRRVVAAYLLLNPDVEGCPSEIKQLSQEMSEEVRESLKTVRVMEFNSKMYTLDSAFEGSKAFNKGLR